MNAHSVNATPHSWPPTNSPERTGTAPTGHSSTAVAVSVEVWHGQPRQDVRATHGGTVGGTQPRPAMAAHLRGNLAIERLPRAPFIHRPALCQGAVRIYPVCVRPCCIFFDRTASFSPRLVHYLYPDRPSALALSHLLVDHLPEANPTAQLP